MAIRLLAAVTVLLAAEWLPAANPRRTQDLSGVWQILPDPDGGMKAPDLVRGGGKWRDIVVPAGWETVLGVDYDGVAWYRRRFAVPKRPAGGRVLLRFHGAATEAKVWVNGTHVGGHLGAWTRFTLDVTEALGTGPEATVVVRLDEKVGHNTGGFLPVIAPHFGGLWQKVELIVLPGGAWLDDSRLWIDARPAKSRFGAVVLPKDMREPDSLTVTVPVRGAIPEGARVVVGVLQPGQVYVHRHPELGHTPRPTPKGAVPARKNTRWSVKFPAILWAPGRPYRALSGFGAPRPPLSRFGGRHILLVSLVDAAGRVLDRVEQSFGFRQATAKGARLLLNGKKLVVRGVLTWGYYPPRLAPSPDPERFRQEMRYLRACGFNLVKFCLWTPPRHLLDLVEEEGLLAWIEYPTWHPKIDKAHREDLLREYDELSLHDCNHPSVILRSITCETGPSADLEVLRELYDLVKRRAPGTLVEDDSSWIGWNRIHDFWDDHTYWNNRTWKNKLRSLDAYRRKKGLKPLVLGEAIAADTWADTAALGARAAGTHPWWLPKCWQDQLRFERRLEHRFARPGFAPVPDLLAVSRKYAMDLRRYQVIELCRTLPDAGYVISTLRDVRLCRMGLFDDLDRPKWDREAWRWHADLARGWLDPGPLPGLGGRGVRDNGIPRPQVVAPRLKPLGWGVENSGEYDPLIETWRLPPPPALPPGGVVAGGGPDGIGVRLFPELPKVDRIPPGTRFVVTQALTGPVLAHLRAGGRVLHLAGPVRGSFKVENLWFLRGTAWAPPEPSAFFARVPRALLHYLQLHDLAGDGVIRGERLWAQVDPLLSFLETHDLDRVRPNLLLFQTRVGRGRLVVSALGHAGDVKANYTGWWLARELVRHLVAGPAPTRALDGETVTALATSLEAQILKVEGPWRFRRDPENVGVQAGWFKPDLDAKGWLALTPRTPAEGRIWNAYDGWGWYRRSLTVPKGWAGRRVRIVFESVDDMYELWLNGRRLGGYGKPDRSSSSYLRRTWVDLTPALRPGQLNQLTLRVYDWVGSGGLNGPVWLTTGPVEKELDLLRR